nr:NAD(P)-dependent oxidoreductase [Chromobacterium sp. ASV5]
MRVLVTGATGGLGRNAVADLRGKGCMVRATGRNTAIGRQLATQGAEFIPLELSTASDIELSKLMTGIDAVWHCAARSAPWGHEADFIAANVTATSKLLNAAGRSGVIRFIHISTPALYFDFRHRMEVPEVFRPFRYVNAYARTKAIAEECALEAAAAYSDMRVTILRPRAIFGEYDQVLMPRLARMLDQSGGRLPLPRGGAVTLDLTYVGNVVHAMWLATRQPSLASGDIFNITNHQPVILRDVLEKLFMEELGQPLRIVTLPYPLLSFASQLAQWVASITGKEPPLTPYSLGAIHFDMTLSNQRARDILGYQPRFSLEEGLVRTARWLQESAHG